MANAENRPQQGLTRRDLLNKGLRLGGAMAAATVAERSGLTLVTPTIVRADQDRQAQPEAFGNLHIKTGYSDAFKLPDRAYTQNMGEVNYNKNQGLELFVDRFGEAPGLSRMEFKDLQPAANGKGLELPVGKLVSIDTTKQVSFNLARGSMFYTSAGETAGRSDDDKLAHAIDVYNDRYRNPQSPEYNPDYNGNCFRWFQRHPGSRPNGHDNHGYFKGDPDFDSDLVIWGQTVDGQGRGHFIVANQGNIFTIDEGSRLQWRLWQSQHQPTGEAVRTAVHFHDAKTGGYSVAEAYADRRIAGVKIPNPQANTDNDYYVLTRKGTNIVV